MRATRQAFGSLAPFTGGNDFYVQRGINAVASARNKNVNDFKTLEEFLLGL